MLTPNRGKRSVALDFKKKEDFDLLQRLIIGRADVLIQNLGAGRRGSARVRLGRHAPEEQGR